MKKVSFLSCTILSAMLLCTIPVLTAQIPSGYYSVALGKNGNELKIALHNIIKGHTSLTYSGLWTAYGTTDVKPNGKIWDIFSDKPGGTPPYQYTYSTDQCASATTGAENDCYNREHLFPQSKFGSNYPMYSDLFFVYPTDAFVNGKKSDYPVGKVGTASFISMNGSKVGVNTYPGSPTGNCFEPIDSFKGDIARSFFYVATRYYSQDGGWANWELANGADLKPWAIQMLLQWHHLDPVSQKEIDRNNKVYSFQNNRNPFIDYPEFADCIWGTTDCTALSIDGYDAQAPKDFSIYPNPAQEYIKISINENVKASVCIIDQMGKTHIFIPKLHSNEVSVSGLSAGIYWVKLITDREVSIKKFIKL